MKPRNKPDTSSRLLPGLAATAIAALSALPAGGASHSDAPLIKQDPQANITDVYAFIGTKYNDPNDTPVLNVLVSVRPFSEPGDGLIYDRFADDALYSIHLTDPATGVTTSRYDFRFSDVNPVGTPGLKNPGTILSYGLGTAAGPISTIGDAQQNYVQTFELSKDGSSLAVGLLTPPPNVGVRTTPAYNDPATGLAVSGAADEASLDSLTAQGVQTLASGEVVFAGPRDDGFFADTPGIFDLLDGRILDNDGDGADGLGQDGGGVDGFEGFNVLSFGIQIPLSDLSPGPYADPFFGPATGVGVYASVSRQRVTIRKSNGKNVNAGPWVQVNRMGNPLFNEALVALADKDKYNRTSPEDDAANFESYALNSELAFLINFVFGTSFAESGRADLAAVFIPDVLRVNTTSGPVTVPGQDGYSRFGFAGGDFACLAGSDCTDPANQVASGGWPNGRRIGDDVIDIALTAVATGPDYSGGLTVVGDNVASNDQQYNQVFPYLATPHSGASVNQRQAPGSPPAAASAPAEESAQKQPTGKKSSASDSKYSGRGSRRTPAGRR